jgi:acetate kinase
MGFTPLEGLVMGTRCGDIDPSIAEFIANEEKLNIVEITNIYNKKSGLLGVSGISHDMRELLEASASGNERANLAIEIYCYRLAKHLAGLMVPLGRVDALIFTGGVGENAGYIRSRVLHNLRFFNFFVDEQANKDNGKNTNGRITLPNSSLALVIPTNEEGMIAKDTMVIINSK